MVCVNIGHNCQHWFQMHERRVALVRLGDKIFALTEARIRIRAFQTTTNNECWIKTTLCQDAGDQAGCGCLAMCTADRNRVTKTH